jgi:hypothetical protein
MLYKYAKKLIIILVLFMIFPLLTLHLSRSLFLGSTFYPVEVSGTLNNPYMGWAPSAEGGPYEMPHKLVYINTTWSELEPIKGSYSFDYLEQKYKFSYWKSKGTSIIFRLNMDFPNQDNFRDIPDWLYEEIDGDGIWYDLDYGKGFSPNYSNPLLIAYHEKLIAALADRYNHDDLISMVALGSIGHWGEWHTKQDPTLSIPFPPLEISDQYAKHYLKSFTNKYLLMRRPFEIAKNNGMGLYNDSFGDSEQTYHFIANVNNGYYDYLANTPQPSMDDYWQYAPSGGEIANPPGLSCLEKDYINDTLKQIKDSHISWLGPSCPAYQPPQTENQSYYDQALKTMGYRFVLYSVKHPPKVKAGGTLPLRMVWFNKGVAPFYFPWLVELSLADVNGEIVYKTTLREDIRAWLPGKKDVLSSLHIPSSLNEGEYDLCVAILNPNTNKPGVELAITNKRTDGRYRLDQIQVTPSK